MTRHCLRHLLTSLSRCKTYILDVEPLHYSTAGIVRRDQADEEATNNGSVCNFVDMVWILKACGINIPQRELASVD